jgi:hypothetical protein
MNARVYSLVLSCSLFACSSDDGGGEDGPAATTGGGQPGDGPGDGADDDPLPMTTGDPPKADLGVDPPADCTFACEVRSECLGESDTDCLLSCTSAHTEHTSTSSACVAAYETLLGCVASLSCEEVGEFQTGSGDYPCAAEELGVDAACAGGEPPPEVCEPLCETTASCTGDGDPAACLTLCGEALGGAEGVSASCLDAQTTLFECVSALSCDDYDAWAGGEDDSPCQAEDDALALACEPS